MIRTLQHTLLHILLTITVLIGSHSLYAQKNSSEGKEYKRDRKHSLTLFSDSASATQAEYMLHLENATQKIDSIQNESLLSPEVMLYGQYLTDCDSLIQFVNHSLIKSDT